MAKRPEQHTATGDNGPELSQSGEESPSESHGDTASEEDHNDDREYTATVDGPPYDPSADARNIGRDKALAIISEHEWRFWPVDCLNDGEKPDWYDPRYDFIGKAHWKSATAATAFKGAARDGTMVKLPPGVKIPRSTAWNPQIRAIVGASYVGFVDGNAYISWREHEGRWYILGRWRTFPICLRGSGPR
jgi:hypothetical protein